MKNIFLILAVIFALSLCALGTHGCASGPQPIPPIFIDADFVNLVGDALNLYIKDSDKAKAAQLILKLVVFIAKKINDSGDPAAAKALEEKAKAIPADSTHFDKAKELGQEAVKAAQDHVVVPAPVVQPAPVQPAPQPVVQPN